MFKRCFIFIVVLVSFAGNVTVIAADNKNVAKEAVIEVRHLERDSGGWERAETSNFTIFYYDQKKDFVEKVVRNAEKARRAAAQK
jgi:hypothetical protein